MNRPLVFFVVSFLVLWMAVHLGVWLRDWRRLQEHDRQDFAMILTATLTLLGLIIGFTFSMAITRYDQRKNYEEAEANAIGTEYVRADLLPAPEAARVKMLLRKYLEQRILFYHPPSERQLTQINTDTAQLQAELWSAVWAPALVRPTTVSALAVSGMNDVLNSQGFTQAAWWNRIPLAAWGLLITVAICSNLLIGYGAHSAKPAALLFFVVPLVVSISFGLIADIDSPRFGVVPVSPQNLISLSKSLAAATR